MALSDWFMAPSAGNVRTIPGDAQQAESQRSYLSDMMGGLQGNQQSLIGFGLGLMSGNSKADAWGNALVGAQRGMVLDASTRKEKKAEEEAAKRRAMYERIGAQMKIDPQIAQDPELMQKLIAQRMQPDDGQIVGSGQTGYFKVFRDGRKVPIIDRQPTKAELLAASDPQAAETMRLNEVFGDPGVGYRWKPGVNGAPPTQEYVPGGARDPTTQASTAATREKRESARRTQKLITGELGVLQDLVDKHGSEWSSTEARTSMGSTYTNLQMQLKNLYDLGAITGPDMEILNDLIPNPTSLWENATDMNPFGSTSMKQRFAAARQTLERIVENNLRVFEGQEPVFPKAGETPSTPKTSAGAIAPGTYTWTPDGGLR